MINHKVLHIGSAEKFMPQFIELIKENFDVNYHEFWLSKGMAEKDIIQDNKTHLLPNNSKTSRLKHYTQVLIKMHQADKIILHSLSDITIVKILFFSPWLLKKMDARHVYLASLPFSISSPELFEILRYNGTKGQKYFI